MRLLEPLLAVIADHADETDFELTEFECVAASDLAFEIRLQMFGLDHCQR